MVRPVDFADAKRRLAFRTRNAHLPLVVHAVGGVGIISVRERVAVACDLLHLVVTADVPKPAVLLVPGDGAAVAQLCVDLFLTQIEVLGVVIESDDHVGADVETAHWAIFTSLGS